MVNITINMLSDRNIYIEADRNESIFEIKQKIYDKMKRDSTFPKHPESIKQLELFYNKKLFENNQLLKDIIDAKEMVTIYMGVHLPIIINIELGYLGRPTWPTEFQIILVKNPKISDVIQEIKKINHYNDDEILYVFEPNNLRNPDDQIPILHDIAYALSEDRLVSDFTNPEITPKTCRFVVLKRNSRAAASNSHYNKYLKYKSKYLKLVNQSGGVKCLSVGFIQHASHCGYDSILTAFLLSDGIGDNIQHIIKDIPIPEILKRPKKYEFLLPINIDKKNDILFNDLSEKYITNIITRFNNKVESDDKPRPPTLARQQSFKCAVNSFDALEEIVNINNKKFFMEELYFMGPQFYNYYFQSDEQKFINFLFIDQHQCNIDQFNIELLNKTSSIIISVWNDRTSTTHAICFFKCGGQYYLYDNEKIKEDKFQPTEKLTTIENNWYAMLKNIIETLGCGKIFTALPSYIQYYNEKMKEYPIRIFSLKVYYIDDFIDEKDYYRKLLSQNINYSDYFNNDRVQKL